MTTTQDAPSENDVLYEFALNYAHPDPERLDECARAHPEHADALTTLAIELALEDNTSEEIVENHQTDAETEAMLLKAMSRFQNRLYAVRAAQHPLRTEDVRDMPRDLFGSRSREQMQALGLKLNISQLFIKRMRDCEIRVDTMTPGFVHEVAEALEEPVADLARYFARPSQIAPVMHFKSDVTPTAGRQLTFEEAVRTSGLTPEQQARLLAL